ncbi:MAG: rhomboid family intramembrane serine protease [Candidatus Bathyarchaeia archaeon]
MIPVDDENPASIRPIVNWLLILASVGVFLWQFLAAPEEFVRILLVYGFTPARILAGQGYYTFLTSMFLHGGLLHLGGNMLYLYIFGDNVEDMCGHLRYLAFYLLSGIVASLAYMFSAWDSPVPAVGASGAISGVLGAYMLLFPKVRIKTLVPVGLFMRFFRVPAFVMIGLWFIYQLLLAFAAFETGIAYWAHIGGFAAGLLLGRPFASRRRRHPLYQRRY